MWWKPYLRFKIVEIEVQSGDIVEVGLVRQLISVYELVHHLVGVGVLTLQDESLRLILLGPENTVSGQITSLFLYNTLECLHVLVIPKVRYPYTPKIENTVICGESMFIQ